jgi:ABC-type multidrug transport system fused ATPase/permease subunit
MRRLTVPYADPGEPDARGGLRYLLWLVRKQPGRVCLGVLFSSIWMLILVVPPYLVSHAIDDGLRARDIGRLGFWVGLLVLAGMANSGIGILRHRTMTFLRLDTGFRTVQVVVRHAVGVGAELPRRVSTGEVVSIGAADLDRIMRTMTTLGPGVGSIVAYAAVAVLLVRISPLLALVVLLGVPALILSLAPLLNRMRDTETAYREQQGTLAARAGDIVAGLRVLCGIGGKDRFAARYHRESGALRDRGYRVGAVSSWIQAVTVGVPSLFLAGVTWLAARMAASGEITVGEMVAVYGYVAMLASPVYFLIEGAQDMNRGVVAARRVVRILDLRPAVPDRAATPCPPLPADLHDPASGLTVRPGELLALAAARPADALAVADRIGRYVTSDATWGGRPLATMPAGEVRRRVLVADNDAYLFAGPLRATVATDRDHDDDEIHAAVHTAVADDIVTGLPDGLAGHLEAQGRDLSGGQRQRLRLVRALLADPEVLILVEPTSAVDAHTESVIAARLRDARHRRSTVVIGTSPLLLDRADRVAFLVDGRVAATGTHAELLATEPAYRGLAYRGSEEELV